MKNAELSVIHSFCNFLSTELYNTSLSSRYNSKTSDLNSGKGKVHIWKLFAYNPLTHIVISGRIFVIGVTCTFIALQQIISLLDQDSRTVIGRTCQVTSPI